MVGDVTQELKLEKEIMEKSGWIKFLGSNIDKWMKEEIGKGITKFVMVNSWIVRQYKNEYNPTHWHNGHISGAGYLKVPKTLGKHYQDKQNRDYRGGNLQLIHGSKMFLSHSTLNIIPEVGDFYFFPNYLMHTVFPFKDTNEERRSISFNANIDEDIYKNGRINLGKLQAVGRIAGNGYVRNTDTFDIIRKIKIFKKNIS